MGALAKLGSGAAPRSYSLAPPPITPKEDEPRHGLGGLLANAWDDVVEAGEGIGKLAGMLVSDVGQLGENAFESVGLNAVTDEARA